MVQHQAIIWTIADLWLSQSQRVNVISYLVILIFLPLSARGGNQESLMRLCLAVEHLQPAAMNMLLEKLAEFTGDEEWVDG